MKQSLTLFLLFITSLAFAQPINDNCSGVIDLGIAPACPDQFFSNIGATASNIGFGNNPSCFNGGLAPRDVWFSFTTNDTTVDYSITVSGLANAGFPAMLNPQVALYRGECITDGLAELACISAAPGETQVRLDVYGLTPNVTYFLRISDYSPTATPNSGSFQLCVDQLSPIFVITDGSSTACFGELYDSGGPDGNYGPNENHTFTICPTDPHSCINFTLDYYNVEGGDFGVPDQISFFDASTADPGALIGSIGGSSFPTDGGGGGVCYAVQASSGCLTVVFQSDAFVNLEGFAGSWQCSTTPCADPAPLSVQGNITEQDILNSITSLQTLVSITDVNCPDRAIGTFQASDDSELGLSRGLLLTTGDINWALGPNNNAGGGNLNANNNAPGDADLDYLSTTFGDGTLSRDACIIEMDVTAFTNEITFEYIFASEEYPEFVNDFNDIFAFLISGPGIIGDPNIGNQQNIAVLPDGSNTLLEINSVNHLQNWEYYRNNENGQSIQYDGLTSDFLGIKKSLTARAAVTPCSTYHLKIAVADRLDNIYDSGVFLSEIRGGTPQLGVQFNSGINYLVENCGTQPDNLNIQLSNVLDELVTYNVVIGGTATLGVDYLLNIPSILTFQPGQTMLSFPVTPLNDNLVEGTETIEISLTNDFGCGKVTYTTLVIELRDQLVLDITPGTDTAFVCQGGTALLSVAGASTYFWTPVSIMSDPLSNTPIATPVTSGWAVVQGNAGICTAIDSVYLQLIDPVISINALDPVAICQGDSVRLSVSNNVNNTNLRWTPAYNISDAGNPNPIVSPDTTITYFASVRLFECEVRDSITIDVNPFDFPVLGNDTLVCQNYPVQLAAVIDAESTNYAWTPVAGLTDPTLSGPLATPDVTTTYTLIATSDNGACADTASITVEVVPADVDMQQPDTLEICLGTQVPFAAVTSTGNANGLLWSTTLPGSLSDTLGLNVLATLTQSATYFTRFEVGACVVFDSVFVRVDSLPERLITAQPEKDPYCPGEIVILTSPIFEPGDFPAIRFEWLSGPGYETADTLWNMVLTTTDTFSYQRVIINRGCTDTTSITLNVIQPPNPSIVPELSTICQGEELQLVVNDFGNYPLTWTPTAGLSCTDCPNPIATPSATTTYNVQVDVPNCPVGASSTIIVEPGPTVDMSPSTTLCLGESVQLNRASDPQTVYRWTSSTDPAFMSDTPLLTVTPQSTTTYTLVAVRGNCQPRTFNVTITVVQPPVIDAGDDITLCRGENATLSAATTPSGSGQFTWTLAGTTTVAGTGSSLSVSSGNLPALNRYVVSYRYGPGNSCGPVSDTVQVNVVDTILINALTADTTTVLVGTPVTLSVSTTPENPGGAMYSWSADGGPAQMGSATWTDNPAPFFAPGQSSLIVRYAVIVKSADGCESIQYIDINVIKPEIAFPNVFTPNGDDLNDLFRPIPGDVLGALIIEDFKVFNRWGQLVYDGRNNNNAGWDGTHNGRLAPSDVYVYKVKFRYPDNPLMEASGDVTLMR